MLNEVPSGWAKIEGTAFLDRVENFFYGIWQHMGKKKAGRPPGSEDYLWGGDRPGTRSDYLDRSIARKDEHE